MVEGFWLVARSGYHGIKSGQVKVSHFLVAKLVYQQKKSGWPSKFQAAN